MAMEIMLFGTFFAMSSMAVGQLWNEPSNAITVKTLYVPLRKGSNSIPIPDFSRVRPLATMNVPNFSVGGDFQLASTVNQNFRPRGNMVESNVHPLQDIRIKNNHHTFKPDLHGQGANFPSLIQNNNIHQQLYRNPPQQTMIHATNHHPQGQHHFYQPEPVSNYVNSHPQNIVLQRNNTVIQHQGNGFSNGNLVLHDTHVNAAGSKMSNLHNPMSYGQQVYTNDNIIIQKIPHTNLAYTQFHNSLNQMQQAFQRGNSANHESISSTQTTDANNSGDSSSHFHQMPADGNPTHQMYMTTPSETPSYIPGHHQINYGVQNEHNNQHMENSNRNNNAHQSFHNQENRYIVPASNNQLQQPVNTYAIVHQRVPNNNFAVQSNKSPPQSEHTYHRQAYETRSPNSHTSYMNNEQTHHEQVPFQVASQNQLKIENSQNSLENQQYQVKQMVPVSIDSQQYNGHPVTTHVQLMMSQIPQTQQDSAEAQYVNQHQSSSGNTEVQNHDGKSSHSHNSMTSTSYPDPTSETYYPENKQIYVSPPPDYSSQVHQQQFIARDQSFARYPPHIETNNHNTQIPISIQNGQVGVHVALPTRNYGYPDQSKYSNGYA